MKTASLYILATIAAIQILCLGLLALCFDNAVLGFMCGACIPEGIHQFRLMRKEAYDE